MRTFTLAAFAAVAIAKLTPTYEEQVLAEATSAFNPIDLPEIQKQETVSQIKGLQALTEKNLALFEVQTAQDKMKSFGRHLQEESSSDDSSETAEDS